MTDEWMSRLHMLPPEQLYLAHLSPYLQETQRELDGKIRGVEVENEELMEGIKRQREEVERLVGGLEGVIGDLEGANEVMDGVLGDGEVRREVVEVEMEVRAVGREAKLWQRRRAGGFWLRLQWGFRALGRRLCKIIEVGVPTWWWLVSEWEWNRRFQQGEIGVGHYEQQGWYGTAVHCFVTWDVWVCPPDLNFVMLSVESTSTSRSIDCSPPPSSFHAVPLALTVSYI